MRINKIKNLAPLVQTRYLSLYNAEYENRKGVTKSWTIASRKNFDTLKAQFSGESEESLDAVTIAAYHVETKSIVLVKQFRVPINDYIYEIPAGLIDGDESIENAVKRELKEETGLNLIKINYDKSKNRVYMSPGMTDESVAIIYCTCEGEISKEYLEDDEDIEAIFITQEEAKEMLKKDLKIDVKTLMVLQGFAYLGEDLF